MAGPFEYLLDPEQPQADWARLVAQSTGTGPFDLFGQMPAQGRPFGMIDHPLFGPAPAPSLGNGFFNSPPAFGAPNNPVAASPYRLDNVPDIWPLQLPAFAPAASGGLPPGGGGPLPWQALEGRDTGPSDSQALSEARANPPLGHVPGLPVSGGDLLDGLRRYLGTSAEQLSRIPGGLAYMARELASDPVLFLQRAGPGLVGLGMSIPFGAAGAISGGRFANASRPAQQSAADERLNSAFHYTFGRKLAKIQAGKP